MNQKINTNQFSSNLLEGTELSAQTLDWIAEKNLWNLWVPIAYQGLELSLLEGLKVLQALAYKDGSLGWTVTLCSGANYFIGNLEPETANQIFLNTPGTICFGGSGGVFGIAEKQGDHFRISGEWPYATGAPYLSHFTCSAEVIADGKPVLNPDGTALIHSFVIPKEAVSILRNWDTMGLKATATHSFKMESVLVSSTFSFVYNRSYLPQPIFKIPFTVFADLSLWVNYLGMSDHFLDEAAKILDMKMLEPLSSTLFKTRHQLYRFAEHIELLTSKETTIEEGYRETIHTTASTSIKEMSSAIITIYPQLGVKACSHQHPINRIFRDYFTATQHHNFTGK